MMRVPGMDNLSSVHWNWPSGKSHVGTGMPQKLQPQQPLKPKRFLRRLLRRNPNSQKLQAMQVLKLPLPLTMDILNGFRIASECLSILGATMASTSANCMSPRNFLMPSCSLLSMKAWVQQDGGVPKGSKMDCVLLGWNPTQSILTGFKNCKLLTNSMVGTCIFIRLRHGMWKG